LNPTFSDHPRSAAERHRSEAERAERGEESEISERPPRFLVRLVILVTVAVPPPQTCGVLRRIGKLVSSSLELCRVGFRFSLSEKSSSRFDPRQ